MASQHGRRQAEEIEMSTKLEVIVTADENSSTLPTVVSPLAKNAPSATKFTNSLLSTTKKVKELDNKNTKNTIGNGNNSVKLHSAGNRRKSTPGRQHNQSVIRLTKMLVLVSTTFLLLNLPSHSIRVYYFLLSWLNKLHLFTHRCQSCLKLFRYHGFFCYMHQVIFTRYLVWKASCLTNGTTWTNI